MNIIPCQLWIAFKYCFQFMLSFNNFLEVLCNLVKLLHFPKTFWVLHAGAEQLFCLLLCLSVTLFLSLSLSVCLSLSLSLSPLSLSLSLSLSLCPLPPTLSLSVPSLQLSLSFSVMLLICSATHFLLPLLLCLFLSSRSFASPYTYCNHPFGISLCFYFSFNSTGEQPVFLSPSNASGALSSSYQGQGGMLILTYNRVSIY